MIFGKSICFLRLDFVLYILLIQQLFNQLQTGRDGGQTLQRGVLHAGLIHLIHIPGGLARNADDLRGNAHRSGVFRHFGEYHRVGGDAGVVAHGEGTQHLGSAADEHVVANGRVALALVLTGTAQRNAVENQTVVTDLRSLANHDAHTVVNDQTAADGGTGVDLDAGEMAGDLRVQTGQKQQFMLIQPVGDPVK